MLSRSVTAVLLVALLASPTWVFAPRAHACSCAVSSVEQRVLASDLVLVGTVRSITRPDGSFDYDLVITADEYLKGQGTPSLTLRDSLQGTACSAFDGGVAPGTPLLLFLYSDGSDLFRTTVCSGSTSIDAQNRERVDEVIAEVRQIVSGEATTAVSEATPTTVATAGGLPDGGARSAADSDGRAIVWPLVLGGAAVVVAGGGLWLRLRR